MPSEFTVIPILSFESLISRPISRQERHHQVGELGQQQVGLREMTEMVGADLALEAVGGECMFGGHDSGVVVEVVEPDWSH